jgi:hypothetical protein
VEAWRTIRYLNAEGVEMDAIYRQLGVSRTTVRHALRSKEAATVSAVSTAEPAAGGVRSADPQPVLPEASDRLTHPCGNVAECKLPVLASQCLARCLGDIPNARRQIAAWGSARNLGCHRQLPLHHCPGSPQTQLPTTQTRHDYGGLRWSSTRRTLRLHACLSLLSRISGQLQS